MIDFFTSRDWQTVNGIFMEVLGAYPEAKKALVARLRALNADAVKEDPDG